jgi:hypothetical protein
VLAELVVSRGVAWCAWAFLFPAAQHVQELGRLGHRQAEVTQGVSGLLQFGGVVGDAEVALV